MDFDIRFHQSQKFLTKPKISDLPEKKEEKVYELLGIDSEIAQRTQLRILDEVKEDELVLIHYFDPLDEVAHIRGTIIYIGDEPRIVAESFPFTDELLLKDELHFSEKFFEGAIVTPSYEGTILRVFQGPKTGEWYMSTHRKINGRRSRWAGPTFGQIFDEIWGSIEERPYSKYMNKDDCYIFLVAHPENRLVCEIPSPSIRLVGRMKPTENGKMLPHFAGSSELSLEEEHSNVIVQEKLKIKDMDEFRKELENVNIKICSGLIVYEIATGECNKFIPGNEYFDKRAIRGNEPNLKLRYLQFVFEPEEGQDPQKLRELFPEKCEVFDKLDEDWKKLPAYLRKLYINRHQKGETSIIPQEEHILTEKTRKSYNPKLSLLQNLQRNLNTSTARQINAMIKHMLKEESE